MNKKLGTAILMTAAMTMAGSVSAYADVDTNEPVSEPEAHAEADNSETEEDNTVGGSTESGTITEEVITVDETGEEHKETIEHTVDADHPISDIIDSKVVEKDEPIIEDGKIITNETYADGSKIETTVEVQKTETSSEITTTTTTTIEGPEVIKETSETFEGDTKIESSDTVTINNTDNSQVIVDKKTGYDAEGNVTYEATKNSKTDADGSQVIVDKKTEYDSEGNVTYAETDNIKIDADGKTTAETDIVDNSGSTANLPEELAEGITVDEKELQDAISKLKEGESEYNYTKEEAVDQENYVKAEVTTKVDGNIVADYNTAPEGDPSVSVKKETSEDGNTTTYTKKIEDEFSETTIKTVVETDGNGNAAITQDVEKRGVAAEEAAAKLDAKYNVSDDQYDVSELKTEDGLIVYTKESKDHKNVIVTTVKKDGENIDVVSQTITKPEGNGAATSVYEWKIVGYKFSFDMDYGHHTIIKSLDDGTRIYEKVVEDPVTGDKTVTTTVYTSTDDTISCKQTIAVMDANGMVKHSEVHHLTQNEVKDYAKYENDYLSEDYRIQGSQKIYSKVSEDGKTIVETTVMSNGVVGKQTIIEKDENGSYKETSYAHRNGNNFDASYNQTKFLKESSGTYRLYESEVTKKVNGEEHTFITSTRENLNADGNIASVVQTVVEKDQDGKVVNETLHQSFHNVEGCSVFDKDYNKNDDGSLVDGHVMYGGHLYQKTSAKNKEVVETFVDGDGVVQYQIITKQNTNEVTRYDAMTEAKSETAFVRDYNQDAEYNETAKKYTKTVTTESGTKTIITNVKSDLLVRQKTIERNQEGRVISVEEHVNTTTDLKELQDKHAYGSHDFVVKDNIKTITKVDGNTKITTVLLLDHPLNNDPVYSGMFDYLIKQQIIETKCADGSISIRQYDLRYDAQGQPLVLENYGFVYSDDTSWGTNYSWDAALHYNYRAVAEMNKMEAVKSEGYDVSVKTSGSAYTVIDSITAKYTLNRSDRPVTAMARFAAPDRVTTSKKSTKTLSTQYKTIETTKKPTPGPTPDPGPKPKPDPDPSPTPHPDKKPVPSPVPEIVPAPELEVLGAYEEIGSEALPLGVLPMTGDSSDAAGDMSRAALLALAGVAMTAAGMRRKEEECQ